MSDAEWAKAADVFIKAVRHHTLSGACDAKSDVFVLEPCCTVAGLVAAAPFMKHDATLGIVVAYELGEDTAKAEVRMLLGQLHQESKLSPGQCNHCRFRYPCPTIQMISDPPKELVDGPANPA